MSSGKVHILTTHPNLRDLRWSPGQILVHLAMSGCGLNTGGLLGTGTISFPVSFPIKDLNQVALTSYHRPQE
jgi:fumarylacetoacetase